MQYERNDVDFHRGTFRACDVVEASPRTRMTAPLSSSSAMKGHDREVDPLRGVVRGWHRVTIFREPLRHAREQLTAAIRASATSSADV